MFLLIIYLFSSLLLYRLFRSFGKKRKHLPEKNFREETELAKLLEGWSLTKFVEKWATATIANQTVRHGFGRFRPRRFRKRVRHGRQLFPGGESILNGPGGWNGSQASSFRFGSVKKGSQVKLTNFRSPAAKKKRFKTFKVTGGSKDRFIPG